MTKRRAKFYLAAMIGSVALAAPWIISVCMSRSIQGNPRAHYVQGLAEIAGWTGDVQNKSELRALSSRIAHNEIIFEYGPLSAEHNGLLGYRVSTHTSGIVSYQGWSDSKKTGRNRIVIRESQVDRFLELIEEVRKELEVAGGLGAEIKLAGPYSTTYKRLADGQEATVYRTRLLSSSRATLIEEIGLEMNSTKKVNSN